MCTFPFADDGAWLELVWVQLYGEEPTIMVSPIALPGVRSPIEVHGYGGCSAAVLHVRMAGDTVWAVPYEIHDFSDRLCPGVLRTRIHSGHVIYPTPGRYVVAVPGYRERIEGPRDSTVWTFDVEVSAR